MKLAGPWYITPTALDQWRAAIDNPPDWDDQAVYQEIAAWAEDAERHSQHEGGKLTKYRAKAPLRAYFLVDETEHPKPALVGVLRPHARFQRGHFQRRTEGRTEDKRSPGRPRTKTPEDAPKVNPALHGDPVRSIRLPDLLWGWCQAQDGGASAYLRRLIERDRDGR